MPHAGAYSDGRVLGQSGAPIIGIGTHPFLQTKFRGSPSAQMGVGTLPAQELGEQLRNILVNPSQWFKGILRVVQSFPAYQYEQLIVLLSKA